MLQIDVVLDHVQLTLVEDILALAKEHREANGFSTNDSELVAFVSYAIAFPSQFLALADTYDTLSSGVPNFLCVAHAIQKAGFTPVPSVDVKPFRVKESPVQLECKVRDIVALGDEGGAGNLVICEVVHMHVNEKVLDADGRIDQTKIDLVGRMGGNWYTRAHGESLFEVEKPLAVPGIGVDQIPKTIQNSMYLNG